MGKYTAEKKKNTAYYNQRWKKSLNPVGPGDVMEVVDLFYRKGRHMF